MKLRTSWVFFAALVLAATAGCSDSAEAQLDQEETSLLRLAYEDCAEGEEHGNVLSYDSEYDVLVAENVYVQPSDRSYLGDETYEAVVEGISERARIYECALDRIAVPEHVLSDISRTRALDGTRSTSWGDFEASWTYHPSNGLNIQFEDRRSE
ncbi:hypothetical protein GCM10009618_20340 [Nesterenkonia lacusekhoensis]